MTDDRTERRRAWVAAANAFIEDPDADVLCPENHDAKLTARFVPGGPDVAGGELIITCPGCDAGTAVRLSEAPQRGKWSDETPASKRSRGS